MRGWSDHITNISCLFHSKLPSSQSTMPSWPRYSADLQRGERLNISWIIPKSHLHAHNYVSRYDYACPHLHSRSKTFSGTDGEGVERWWPSQSQAPTSSVRPAHRSALRVSISWCRFIRLVVRLMLLARPSCNGRGHFSHPAKQVPCSPSSSVAYALRS
jgi:hypothetical protein